MLRVYIDHRTGTILLRIHGDLTDNPDFYFSTKDESSNTKPLSEFKQVRKLLDQFLRFI